ncbi:MAG: hypothetical protein COY66_02190 [Candidatus Kerfeldbacteria bacterium CG_4_10_14_0_8_um_filter_42_10]|uniref:Uncharacterized protein n=1 Tax=Candidatus Kerfeldbacteria bacterium CG_4_10_14_0_8_um_filter_42_10 TaxID=2014248 RepID=A0A2M7RJM3_9BACT|nr:MAG: hypothetical protein COY66_02190 [Candidatus Kerfeldbacteria bacterium CG_4_10_14_0_8_um_filter_42_10]
MEFKQFQKQIHQKGFLIVCLNDYKLKGDYYTFIAVQDKKGRGFHAEGKSANLSKIYQGIIVKMNRLYV